MSKVLFIEDSSSWQDILRKLLETAGHEAHRANSFDSAINILSGRQPFDVIVFDLLLGEKSATDDTFLWLDALIQGMRTRKLVIPPIIIVTGVDVSKQEIIQAFTDYREVVFGFFEKRDFHPKDFLQTIKEGADYDSHSQRRPKSFGRLLAYTILMTLIVLSTFAVLLWSVKQISDPQTQQTILQVGGAVIVIIAVFITVFSQNTKLENIAEIIAKIWRG